MRGLFFGGIVAGVLLGFGLGLVAAWSSWPSPVPRAIPADLRLDLKDDYIRMIASSYSLDGDLARAMGRLDSLKLSQAGTIVTDLARREPNPQYQQALIHLALDLKQPAAALARPTFTPRPTRMPLRAGPTIIYRVAVTPTAIKLVQAPAATPSELTPLPPTLAPNPGAPLFFLRSTTELFCYDTQGKGLIAIEVQGADGRPVPGVGVELSWGAGYEVFYTGFKPERGMGYADAIVSPGTYNVRLTGEVRSEVVPNLRVDYEPTECGTAAHQIRGWKLDFVPAN